MQDSAMPTSKDEYLLRSVRAVKHFWPNAPVPRAIYISREQGHTVVDGGTWQVQWETAAYAADYDKFMARFATCEEGCNQELFARAASLKEEKV
jgi:hypothetical protein